MTAEDFEDDGARVRAEVRRGRGARSNASGRHEPHVRLSTGTQVPEDEEPAPLRTVVSVDASRSIVSRNSSPDIPFELSINPYRGCEHGCIYCYARPSHAHLGLSPGLDFETRLFAKPDAPALLAAELAKPSWRVSPIALGSNTDPYQPIEREWRIMRGILEVLDAANHPLTIVTKSALVTRDLDILASMAKRDLVKVALSVTTLDRHLARRMEPRAATPGRRLEAMRALADAGVPVGVMVAPVIPALNDHEIEAILVAARDAGAIEAGRVMLRLPLEIADLFTEWLRDEFPDRANRVMSHVRAMRGGRLNDPRFGKRMGGEGAYAETIGRRFALAARRLGLNTRRIRLDCSRFRPPPADRRQGVLAF